MEKFSALLAICEGNSLVTGEFPTQMPVTQSFDVFFDLHLNKRLSKQWWGWWFEMHRAHYDGHYDVFVMVLSTKPGLTLAGLSCHVKSDWVLDKQNWQSACQIW